MAEINSFRAVISLWPSADALAAELGVGTWAARKWLTRDSIPASWWQAILSSPRARAAGLSAEKLAELAAAQPAEARA